jgi:Asp-tRNA(Asn)/Glu-tRNA(Gln) amidotransferase A subunit family amidase
VELANMAGIIERLEGELALGKEPARFIAALEGLGEDEVEAPRPLEADAAAGCWRGPLHGVPLGFKDLCHLRGLPTSCGTRMPEYFIGAG